MSNRFSVHNHNRKWKNGDLPMNAFVSVNLASHATAQGVGEIALTCQLANDAEVDYEIDCLIKELEAIRKAAKNEIMRHNEKVLSSLIRKTDSECGDESQHSTKSPIGLNDDQGRHTKSLATQGSRINRWTPLSDIN